MGDEVRPGDFVTFVRQGGAPVSIVRYSGIFVRVTRSGGKPVTFARYSDTRITVDDERSLPEDVRQELGY